jgi:hypothetical protein
MISSAGVVGIPQQILLLGIKHQFTSSHSPQDKKREADGEAAGEGEKKKKKKVRRRTL